MYSWSTYIHCDGSKNTCHDIGSDIGGTGYDAATANWGAPWRMPSLTQIQELLDNTTSTLTTQNGVDGQKFTGSNGGSVFLPAAGVVWAGNLGIVGTHGRYWSSTPEGEFRAYDLCFGSGFAGWYNYWNSYRNQLAVRPMR